MQHIKITPLHYTSEDAGGELVMLVERSRDSGYHDKKIWYAPRDITLDQLNLAMTNWFGECTVDIQLPLFELATKEYHVGDLFEGKNLRK